MVKYNLCKAKIQQTNISKAALVHIVMTRQSDAENKMKQVKVHTYKDQRRRYMTMGRDAGCNKKLLKDIFLTFIST